MYSNENIPLKCHDIAVFRDAIIEAHCLRSHVDYLLYLYVPVTGHWVKYVIHTSQFSTVQCTETKRKQLNILQPSEKVQ